MSRILMSRDIFKIFNMRIITLPILVVNLMAFWAWSYKRMSYQAMCEMICTLSTEAKRVADIAIPNERSNGVMGTSHRPITTNKGSYSPMAAYLVMTFETFYLAPDFSFHEGEYI